jgi:hypothetical protein
MSVRKALADTGRPLTDRLHWDGRFSPQLHVTYLVKG